LEQKKFWPHLLPKRKNTKYFAFSQKKKIGTKQALDIT
jgi:hypothetical protein